MTSEEQEAYDEAVKRIEACRHERGTTLSLARIGLTRLPPEIGRLANLTRLSLDHNQLGSLPPEIGQLRNLSELYLQNNQLRTLPPEIGQLRKLHLLALLANHLRALPVEIGQLIELSLLDLDENKLETLPLEIGRLANLKTIYLGFNGLVTLPDTLRDLRKLRLLSLRGNDALGLPSELLGPAYPDSSHENPPANPQAILDYYFARKEQGEAPIQEVRVLLVGRGRVGKTSLLNVLQGRRADPVEHETPGITVEKLELRCSQGRAKAHVWDFGGQEFLHGTHQIFLSERCVYVLVLEGREGNWETETDYWLRFIQSYGGDSPVVVALNKYDLHPFSVDRHRLTERCPQIAGFVETDAFTGRGVNELRSMREATVNQMKDVWLGVPRKWHRIKEALESMATSFFGLQGLPGAVPERGRGRGAATGQPGADAAPAGHRAEFPRASSAAPHERPETAMGDGGHLRPDPIYAEEGLPWCVERGMAAGGAATRCELSAGEARVCGRSHGEV